MAMLRTTRSILLTVALLVSTLLATAEGEQGGLACLDYLETALENNLGVTRQVLELEIRSNRDYLNELRHAHAQQQHPSSKHYPANSITSKMIEEASENFAKRLASLKEFEESSVTPQALAVCVQEASSSTPQVQPPASAVLTAPIVYDLFCQSLTVAANHTAQTFKIPIYVVYRHWAFAIYVFNKLWAEPDDLPQQMFHANISDRTALAIEATAYPLGAFFLTVAILVVGIVVLPVLVVYVVIYKWLWILWVKLFLFQGIGKIPAAHQYLTAAPKWIPEILAKACPADLALFLGTALIVLAVTVIVLLPWIFALRRLFTPTSVVAVKH